MIPETKNEHYTCGSAQFQQTDQKWSTAKHQHMSIHTQHNVITSFKHDVWCVVYGNAFFVVAKLPRPSKCVFWNSKIISENIISHFDEFLHNNSILELFLILRCKDFNFELCVKFGRVVCLSAPKLKSLHHCKDFNFEFS